MRAKHVLYQLIPIVSGHGCKSALQAAPQAVAVAHNRVHHTELLDVVIHQFLHLFIQFLQICLIGSDLFACVICQDIELPS